ncbi:MAG: hypothetical protein LBQ87_09630 [Candidatus Fibromonas sp.]|jgi:hypothetical protein|nr:hypothetical protein [Candidatus Fibromonas sp.]
MAVIFISCEEEANVPATDETENDNDYIEPALELFKEPSELRIGYRKARNFNKASEALVIMGQEWAEKMSQVSDEEKLKMAASYEKAQDDLIRKFGISGKEEFKWLQTKALPDPSNRDVFARAGVWINRH